jgi:hypothetical protein
MQLGDASFGFYWRDELPPEPLRLHRDSASLLVLAPKPSDTAGLELSQSTDGGVKWREERMSAGYAAGTGPVPNEELVVLL